MSQKEKPERVPVYTQEQIAAMEKHFRKYWLGSEAKG